MFTWRGDKDRNMDISVYLDKFRLYLRALINEKKISDQKTQLNMAKNLRHIPKNDRITFISNQRILYAYHQIIQKIY